jgi:hypothetical protein
MINRRKNVCSLRIKKGLALILAMIFLAVFGAFAAAMASMSSSNVEMSVNQTKANAALMNAQSGAEIVRYILDNDDVTLACALASDDLISELTVALQTFITLNSVTAVSVTGDGTTITIPSVTLNIGQGQTFSANISRDGDDSLRVDVTGYAGSVARKIRTKYEIRKTGNPNFDYGVATKGPLHMKGNTSVTGAAILDSKVYIDSRNEEHALEIGGGAYIQGDVQIFNPNADLTGIPSGSVGGTIQKGVPRVEFPIPDPEYFEKYATGTVYNVGATIPSTLTNAVIGPGVNPSFSGGTINGILYIKQPNVVRFSGNTIITGLIVCEGDVDDDSGVNSLTFRGTVDSFGVANLPQEEQYAELRKETGTFIMAPGFKISMGGTFGAINGTMVANGFDFGGCAMDVKKGAKILGSVINYSDEPMELGGTSDLYFNRSTRGAIPAGFDSVLELSYDATTYEEPAI